MRLILVTLYLLAITAMGQGSTAPAKDTPTRLVLELSDGSRIVGTPSIDRLKMSTDYANLEIPLSIVRTIDFSGPDHAARLTLQNGDLLSSRLAASNITLKTIFGQATIPMSEVLKFRITPASAAVSTLPEGLVLHYTFDTDEGDRVTDMSDAGNNGKVHGAIYTRDGKIGGAMSFNGDRQAVVVGNPASLQLQDFTIMAWIKRGSMDKATALNGGDGHIFSYGNGGYGFGMHPDGQLFLSKIDINNVAADCNISDQTFHYVAVSKHAGQVIFYLDGVAYPASNYNPGFEFDTDVAVAARPDDFRASFLGVIDEVAVFNQPLTANEIKNVYESQK